MSSELIVELVISKYGAKLKDVLLHLHVPYFFIQPLSLFHAKGRVATPKNDQIIPFSMKGLNEALQQRWE